MSYLYAPLSLPVSIFKSAFNKKKYSTARHHYFDKEEISLEYLDFIKDLGLHLSHAEVFFSIPGEYYTIHRDQHQYHDFPKINFIIGGENSEMNWYSVKENIVGENKSTKIQTPYVGYKPEEVELIFKTKLNSTSLVQAGVPHNVTSKSLRWAISTVYKNSENKHLTWNQCLEIFQPYLIS